MEISASKHNKDILVLATNKYDQLSHTLFSTIKSRTQLTHLVLYIIYVTDGRDNANYLLAKTRNREKNRQTATGHGAQN